MNNSNVEQQWKAAVAFSTARKAGEKLINYHVKKLTGGTVSLSDLADTPTLMNGLDDIQGYDNFDEACDRAEEVAQEMLIEEGCPL